MMRVKRFKYGDPKLKLGLVSCRWPLNGFFKDFLKKERIMNIRKLTKELSL